MGLTLRRATKQDVEGIKSLTEHMHIYECRDYVPSIIDRWLDRGDIVIIAEDKDEIVGMVHLEIVDSVVGWASAIRVRAERRGEGIGGRLLKELISSSKMLDLKHIRALTSTDNKPAINILRGNCAYPIESFIWVSVPSKTLFAIKENPSKGLGEKACSSKKFYIKDDVCRRLTENLIEEHISNGTICAVNENFALFYIKGKKLFINLLNSEDKDSATLLGGSLKQKAQVNNCTTVEGYIPIRAPLVIGLAKAGYRFGPTAFLWEFSIASFE
jgi:N-acetylglutamate synthase-like GNAT family acetyltransferase